MAWMQTRPVEKLKCRFCGAELPTARMFKNPKTGEVRCRDHVICMTREKELKNRG